MLSIINEAIDVVVGDFGDYVLLVCSQSPKWEMIFRSEDITRHTGMCVGVSMFFEDIGEIIQQINNAITALSYKFISGTDAVYYYDELKKNKKIDSAEEYKELSNLLNSISFSPPVSAKKSTLEFLLRFVAVHPSNIALAKKICSKIYGTLEDRYIHEIETDDNGIEHIIKQPQSISEYRDTVSELFDRLSIQNSEKETDLNSIDTAVRYIKQNYERPISLKTLSGLVFLSPEYFCRLFKNKTGVSFSAYLTTYRLDKAKQLLTSTDLKISEIATRVGYDNPSYFSKLYRKHMNMTPEQQRKSI